MPHRGILQRLRSTDDYTRIAKLGPRFAAKRNVELIILIYPVETVEGGAVQIDQSNGAIRISTRTRAAHLLENIFIDLHGAKTLYEQFGAVPYRTKGSDKFLVAIRKKSPFSPKMKKRSAAAYEGLDQARVEGIAKDRTQSRRQPSLPPARPF
jgi:hypothetical protein